MLTFELNGSMKAILQLEQRIMAELTEVQEIQDKLANSRMVRNMEQDDFRAALFNREDSIDNIVIKSTTSEVGRGIRKSNFQRRGSVTRDRSNRSSVIKSSTNIKVHDAFEPTYSVISSQYEGRRQDDSSGMGRSSSKHRKPSDKHTEKGTNLKILKPRRENRRWSILDCEEIESKEVNREHTQGSKISKGNLRLVSNSSSALNLKQNNVSHSGINKNKAQQYNKENINSNYMASPCKRGGRLNSSGLRQESTSSLLDSKKKERDYPEYSFRPQLSSKSMKIAEGLDQSAFERLTTVQDKWKPTTEDMELLNCTFSPDINLKSVEIDQIRNKSAKREERLLIYGENSKKKIEKLKASEYIKKELEFRNECSFTPTLQSNHPVAHNQNVLERLENWQKKREANLNQLSMEAKSRIVSPSFQPKIEQLKPEIMRGLPEAIIRDRFLMEGMAEHLRRQNKAKNKRESSKEAANKHQVLRDYLGY